MGRVLHGSTTTMEANRRAIQHSQASLRALSRRYGYHHGDPRRAAAAPCHRDPTVRDRAVAFLAQIVQNAKALARALYARGVSLLGAHKDFTETHQAVADVRSFGRGLAATQRLERANIITNKNLIPGDSPE